MWPESNAKVLHILDVIEEEYILRQKNWKSFRALKLSARVPGQATEPP